MRQNLDAAPHSPDSPPSSDNSRKNNASRTAQSYVEEQSRYFASFHGSADRQVIHTAATSDQGAAKTSASDMWTLNFNFRSDAIWTTYLAIRLRRLKEALTASPRRSEVGVLLVSLVALPYLMLSILKVDHEGWKIFLLAATKFLPMAVASQWISDKSDTYAQGVTLGLLLYAFRDLLSELPMLPQLLDLMACAAIIVLGTALSNTRSPRRALWEYDGLQICSWVLWFFSISTRIQDIHFERITELMYFCVCGVISMVSLLSPHSWGTVLLMVGELHCLGDHGTKFQWVGLLWLMQSTQTRDRVSRGHNSGYAYPIRSLREHHRQFHSRELRYDSRSDGERSRYDSRYDGERSHYDAFDADRSWYDAKRSRSEGETTAFQRRDYGTRVYRG
eukprot:GEMP01024462.1.p1 GENE.GEMP01024462.1~~GEMP01024462.1.p1  ORF type:complete len:391 (+),score=71.00 GEMP01024462.1:240-1412(+)